jgi:serine/threonine protein kinase
MPVPTTTEEFLELVRKSGVVEDKRLSTYVEKMRAASSLSSDPGKAAGFMVRDGILTHFQAEQVLQGKWRRFTIGKYKVLERLGAGGMGSVYLCEHKLMRRRVAVKVLPTAKADDPSSLERFYREARAVAALDHPNIVRAYDIDQDDKLHFLVMEYVDGSSLQEIIKKTGPMDVLRAVHYMYQSAQGLQHAYESAGLVHRDIKPGNILIDRTGVVKILDMGLARFFNDEEDILTKKYDENVLGTADYLAPEQALDSHSVDIRADIYSLGATFYFCLTGRTPFTEGTVAQKLIWHQTRQPKPIRQLRPEVPAELVAIIEKMMAKDPAQRPATPLEVAEMLKPWTETPIGPPLEEEMPRLSPAALGLTAVDYTPAPPAPPSAPGSSSGQRKNWQVTAAANSPRPGTNGEPVAARGSAGATAPVAGAVVPSSTPTAPSKPVRTSASPAPVSPPSGYRPAIAPLPPRPRPAAAPSGPAPQEERKTAVTTAPTPPAPLAEENDTPWEQLAPDTGEVVARGDTPRALQKPVPPGSSGGLSGVAARIMTPDRKRAVLVIGIVTAVLLGTLAAVAVWALYRDRTGGPAHDQPPPGRTLKVGKDGEYKTVHAAVQQVRRGDRIVVQGPTVEEELIIDGSKAPNRKNFTIEPEEGQTVTWQPRPGNKPAGHLIYLNHAEGVRIRGFLLDGQSRCKPSVVLLRGRCPGSGLEHVTLQGFVDSGVMVMNCEGDPDRAVTFSDLTIRGSADNPPVAGVTFGIDRDTIGVTTNRYISLSRCRLEGNFRKPISVLSPDKTRDVKLDNVTTHPTPDAPGKEIPRLPTN